MDSSTTQPGPSPERDTVIPDSYAIYADDYRITVWQFRVDVANPDGKWHFVESLDREKDPKVSVDQATFLPPSGDGYWIYAKTYDCKLDC